MHQPTLRRLAQSGIAALVTLLTGVTLLAHDMWIEPSSFVPDVNRTTGLRLRVGENFLGDPLVRDPNLIEQFVYTDGASVKPVVGRDGGDPAGLIRPTAPGLFIVGYHSKPNPIVLDAQKFNDYLKEEGLEAVAAVRTQRGQTNSPAKEIFVRCAKTLILVGSAADTQRDRPLGFPLELVAERNPYMLARNNRLALQLLYKGQPLSGALVVAMNKFDRKATTSARSDKSGRVELPLDAAGPWLVKAVHMIVAPEDSGSEWASFWASLTFELQGPTGDLPRK